MINQVAREAMRGLLLADDLSGLLDAAAAFHAAGVNVEAAVATELLPQIPHDAIAAVSSETRNASPTSARDTIRSILAAARSDGRELLFKKIDSTLRGPVAAELAALAEFLPRARILFAPANPIAGRTVREGILRVHGIPVSETEYGRDPVYPVKTSSIERLLGDAASSKVIIPNVETENDLVTAVQQMNATPDPWVAVGSGALARAVAQQRGQMRRLPTVALPRTSVALSSATLVVCGSSHVLNRTQAEQLRTTHGVPCYELDVQDVAGTTEHIRASLAAHSGAAVLLPSTRIESSTALTAIVTAAADVIRETGVRRIFVTGGETAFALCRALGIARLTFLSEIEPGVTLSLGESQRGPFLLAIKPGGFGDAATWVRAWDRLREI